MIYLKTVEYGLPKILDRDLPEWAQYTSEIDIYRGYRCMQCGDIITEESEMLGHKCKNDASDWEEIEVTAEGEMLEVD